MTDTRTPPKIENVPGIIWRPLKVGWQARWQCRTDIIERGFEFKSCKLWSGPEEKLTPLDIMFIQDRCNALQGEMLAFAHGGIPVAGHAFDGTVMSLADVYQTDADSNYRKLRFKTRKFYANILRGLVRDYGTERIENIKARQILRWHEQWGEGGKKAIAHARIGMLRTIVNFGATILEDGACAKLAIHLSNMKFEMPKARNERITAEQAEALRNQVRPKYPSMALGQAFQFEILLRQKDVIGEWIPISEPGLSDMTAGNKKWLRGIQWQEVDQNLVLRHVTSKRQKEIEVDLKAAPMVCEELELAYPGCMTDRSILPSSGPIIIREDTGIPWYDTEYRRIWRLNATACGIPKAVKNMDSRAGGISEATDAGADLEHVRHAATHSDIKMTSRYSRNSTEKVATVQKLRAEHRNKRGTA